MVSRQAEAQLVQSGCLVYQPKRFFADVFNRRFRHLGDARLDVTQERGFVLGESATEPVAQPVDPGQEKQYAD